MDCVGKFHRYKIHSNCTIHTDILLVLETHLTPTVSDANTRISGYTLVRNDNGSTSKYGVCAYVADHLQFDQVDA